MALASASLIVIKAELVSSSQGKWCAALVKPSILFSGTKIAAEVGIKMVMEIDEPEELTKFAHCGRLREVTDCSNFFF